ncbi:hypothetical protein GDO86_017980 [Hymenochirus boettgeri]|uniref:Uncharacterized protein n=1 Tax=Hymenochirus boettgeri TaxID=247094 RepID=A0A8T2IHU4_9PIPI|nr:hypothetical protein GDO86_017980 [Hymenochirus boettgeri]
MLEGSCRLHPPTVSHPSRSVIQKENAKKILDLISNIIHLLTGEVVKPKRGAKWKMIQNSLSANHGVSQTVTYQVGMSIQGLAIYQMLSWNWVQLNKNIQIVTLFHLQNRYREQIHLLIPWDPT